MRRVHLPVIVEVSERGPRGQWMVDARFRLMLSARAYVRMMSGFHPNVEFNIRLDKRARYGGGEGTGY